MIDAHIHFHNQEYSLEMLDKMALEALKKGIDEINVLDHTHKFQEFAFLYQDLIGPTKEWYEKKKPISIQKYLDFIKLAKTKSFKVKINFGLEVCYFYDKEEQLRKELSKYHFDFLIGSIHFIENEAFDISADFWQKKEVNEIYQKYYELMGKLVDSKMFTYLGHMDSIKVFQKYPSYDLEEIYTKIINKIKLSGIIVENNSGLIRYGFPYPGLNPLLLSKLKEAKIPIVKSSDAHNYLDIGRVFSDF